LPAEKKELFNKLPPELKAETAKLFKDHESHFTKALQETRAAQKDAEHIIKAVRPYLQSKPDLIANEYTEGRLVGELLAAHMKLEDPKTALGEYLRIGAQIGINPKFLEHMAKSVPAQQQASPQIAALHQRLHALESNQQQVLNQAEEDAINSAVEEIQTAIEEKDASGRYLWPELHDESYRNRVQPLASQLLDTYPNLSWGDALKQIVLQQRQIDGTSTQQPNQQAKLPAQTNQTPQQAAQAAVSVRGRSSAPSAPGELKDVPDEALANPRATVAWALKNMRGG